LTEYLVSVRLADISTDETAWRMPAEWEPHDRCLMAWPTRDVLWGAHVEQAKREYAETADAIASFEPVTMVTSPGQAAQARTACSASIEVVELPIDDSWLRDSGPIFVVDDAGSRCGVDFRFNSWGERFTPFDKDAAVACELLAALGVPRAESSMVLEGGSITVDGEGTLITTEQCLRNSNRNPGMSRTDIEAELRRTLGVTTVIWLRWGGHEDEHTDGHVDGVCTYVRPAVVIAQTCDDPENPNFPLMAENLEILRAARDAKGRPIEVIEVPFLPYFMLDGQELVSSYPNFYIANGGVVVPTANHPLDAGALAVIRSAFPDREVVGVNSRVIAYGGGGTHCITQQVPRG
jgi:agmatine deiminase